MSFDDLFSYFKDMNKSIFGQIISNFFLLIKDFTSQKEFKLKWSSVDSLLFTDISFNVRYQSICGECLGDLQSSHNKQNLLKSV
jgi:homoserine trans-succinylase